MSEIFIQETVVHMEKDLRAPTQGRTLLEIFIQKTVVHMEKDLASTKNSVGDIYSGNCGFLQVFFY
jgi:hypothetical protein